jgi:hypothetical protein
MKGWGELLTYQEQLNGRVDAKGLLRLISEPEVQVLKCIREPCAYGIFRVVTLATCEAAYSFYGAGYHKNRGYIHDRWVFDLDLEAVPLKEPFSKKSVIVTISRDVSWFKKRAMEDRVSNFPLALFLDDDKELNAAMEGAIAPPGSLTALGAVVSPSPNYQCSGPGHECNSKKCPGGPCPEP